MSLEAADKNHYRLAEKRVWVAGHRGMVGSAIVRRLKALSCDVVTAARDEVDLTDQSAVAAWLHDNRPEAIFLAAARVGGIHANDTLPARFLYENLMIQTNVLHSARETGVQKLLFLGSSCIYPRDAVQPMNESSLLTGPLEPTNQWYAIAKIAGVKMCEAYRRQYGCDFISVMPTNLYGPGDNFDLEFGHAPAALLRRFHEAKESGDSRVVVWGTGTPRREFMHVDDLADGCVFLMAQYSGEEPVNVGVGEDVTIAEFATLIATTVGYNGEIVFDTSRADGVPQKLLDVSRMHALGWASKTPLGDGLRSYYQWFLENRESLRC